MDKRIVGWGGMAAVLALAAVGAAQTAGGPPAEVSPAGHNLLQLLQRGGPVMYPLYVCSILVVAFWIERLISLRRNRVIPPGVLDAIHEASVSRDPEVRRRLLDEIQAGASPMARIIKAGGRKLGRPPLEVEKAIEDAAAREVARLQRNNKVFSVVATIAPLLGLLGTVTGLMRSFMNVAMTAEALGRTELLAAGIYEALVATAVGLSIAIPSMALYFYYQEQVDKLVARIDEGAVEFLETLSASAAPPRETP